MVTALVSRVVTHLRQFLCGLHGHDALLHFADRRMSLKCTSCGYETPGWDCTALPRSVERDASDSVRVPFISRSTVATRTQVG